MILASLSEAIEWVEAHWAGQRPAPMRLHVRGTEGRYTIQGSVDWHSTTFASDSPAGTERLGSPPFSHAFMAALDGSAAATMTATIKTPCSHPGRASGAACSMCSIYDGDGKALVETGVYERKVDRYQFPMTLALDRLSTVVSSRRQPHPYALVLTLAEHGWDWRATARSLAMHPDLAEALLLRTLRQLHSRYEEGPVGRPSWVDKSESQQRAEGMPAA